MPLYDYICKSIECGAHFERVLTVSECDRTQRCPNCGEKAHKIIALGHGGIYRTGDSMGWVKDAAKVLTNGDRPNPNIETVQDLRRFYKANPNIIPKESHPAFPSSMGDAYDKPDLAYEKKQRSKAGNELIRKMRSIEVTGRAATATAPG